MKIITKFVILTALVCSAAAADFSWHLEREFASTNEVRVLAFAPKSHRLISASGRAVTVWSRAGAKLTSFEHRLPVSALAFSSSGKWLLSTGSIFDGGRHQSEFCLWHAQDWSLAQSWTVDSNDVNVLVFLNENTVVAGGLHGLSIWALKRGNVVKQIPTDAAVLAIALLPGSTTLAAGTFSHCIYEWDTRNWQVQRRFENHKGEPRAVALFRDGTLASGDAAGELILWDRASGAALWTNWNVGVIHGLAFLDESHLLGAGGEPGDGQTGRIWLWDLVSRRREQSLETSGGAISAFAITDDRRRFATGNWLGNIRIWAAAGP